MFGKTGPTQRALRLAGWLSWALAGLTLLAGWGRAVPRGGPAP